MKDRAPIRFFIVAIFILAGWLVRYHSMTMAERLDVSLRTFGTLLFLVEIAFSFLLIRFLFWRKSEKPASSKNWLYHLTTITMFALVPIASTPVNLVHRWVFHEKVPVEQGIIGSDIGGDKTDEGYSVTEKANYHSKGIGFIGLAAFAEELKYRVIILGLLLTVFSGFNAVVISSLIFGISHLWAQLGYEPSMFFSSFTVASAAASGLVFGAIYLRSGLVGSFLSHFMSNFAVFYLRKDPIYWEYFIAVIVTLLLTLGVILAVKALKALKRRFIGDVQGPL